MARFFIDRPIFAWVLAILIMIGGALSIHQLSLEQYPDIAPPQVSVSATYNGASAKTVEDSVTQVIEQQMKGLDRLQSMSSNSTSSGRARVTLSFTAGTDSDIALMQVQNKVQQAMSRLPQAVQSQGVTVTKSGEENLLVVSLYSDDPSVTSVDIGDYVSSNLVDVISRIDGVGEVQTFGSGYAMRIWLDPGKLVKYALIPSDITSALTAQNTQVSAGQLGGLPAPSEQLINATISARSRLTTVEEFENVVIKSASDGTIIRLADVARVELGADNYSVVGRLNGKPTTGMGIRLAAGANALGVADAVKAKIAELEPYFPNQMHSIIPYDTTPFVKVSIEEVAITLIEAVALVVAVMFLFMQNLRATLIPAITVPVVLLGTFGVLAAFGYSINTLTMFGMVLAIGLLVGIALVLSAVFIPMAFFGGSTGVIYRQFSITIVSSMLLSVFVAMTLTPALCASLLRASDIIHDVDHHADAKPHGPAQRFFAWFNHAFVSNAGRYEKGVGGILQRGTRFMLIYALILGALGASFVKLPTSFLPEEDQGRLMMMVQLPPGSSYTRTDAVLHQVESYLSKQADVTDYMTIVGINGDQASANGFIQLKDWSQRKGKGQDAASLARKMTADLSQIRDARVFVIMPALIRGLGSSAGFTVELQDLAGNGHEALVKAREQFLKLAREDKRLAQVRISGLDDVAQFSVDIDDRKASALKLATSHINSTLSTALGGSYVNDFIDRSRVKKVYVQGDAAFRMKPDDLGLWHVRNSLDEMVPFSTFASTRWTYGSPRLERYSGMSSYEIVGSAAEGVSSGDAMQAVEEIIKQLPPGISYEWAGQSYQERLAGSQAPALYAISILFVFLCLAALYESWSVPFSVLLVVPLGVIGAVLATWLAGLENDVYFQIGLLTTVGLSAKNAILIVEFAKALREQGRTLVEATLEAVRLRLRPILMTSLAFMFGVLPLAFSTGAGSASRRAIGTGVLGGMATATVLGLVFVPLFYVLVCRLFERRRARQTLIATPASAEGGA